MLTLILARTKQLRRRRGSSDKHMVLVYRCTVTPTRVILFPAEQETSNDVIRKHARHIDRFLRVQFTDEDSVMVSELTCVERVSVAYRVAANQSTSQGSRYQVSPSWNDRACETGSLFGFRYCRSQLCFPVSLWCFTWSGWPGADCHIVPLEHPRRGRCRLPAGLTEFREHGCWFFADELEPGGLTADTIRENIGLHNISETIVAKYGGTSNPTEVDYH